MTALKQYQRLESSGLWKASAEAQRREVLISFGNATLVMSDGAGRPLTHWSLSTVNRLNQGTRPALFAPSDDTSETLEIEDAEMIKAIETVRSTIEKARPRPGRLRWIFRLGLPIALIASAITFGPELLIRQTISVVPQVKRSAFGSSILTELEKTLGPRCNSPQGRVALSALTQRLLGRGGEIVILPRGFGLATGLPGGVIALDQDLIENTDDPHVIAGHVLAAHSMREMADPLTPLLRHAGSSTTVRLLTTGDITPQDIERYTESLLQGDRSFPAIADLQERFDRAQVLSGPYFASQGIAVDAPSSTTTKPVLSDGQWVALQGICLD